MSETTRTGDETTSNLFVDELRRSFEREELLREDPLTDDRLASGVAAFVAAGRTDETSVGPAERADAAVTVVDDVHRLCVNGGPKIPVLSTASKAVRDVVESSPTVQEVVDEVDAVRYRDDGEAGPDLEFDDTIWQTVDGATPHPNVVGRFYEPDRRQPAGRSRRR